MTGRRNDPQGLRRRILDAAFDRFVARGYAATPLQDLRAESGATGDAFAHHFPTKKALALAV
ncbi:MAG: helix-turn-helix domain-containing protein, partial [Albimonas sp.]|uniref:helix-turn-helix domain-containing protein n=1 Tax=Albimonas sp. TaxID=1872425 RepID=UPI0040571F76